MKQYLITTDIHFSIDKIMGEAEWFLGWFGHYFPKFAKRCNQGAAFHIQETFLEASKHGPYCGLIELGDRTHGTEKDTGIDTPHAIKEANCALELLKNSFPEIPPQCLYLVPGNHDLGWALSSFTRWGNGYLQKSLAQYRQIYGPLFGANKIGDDTVLIRLTSEPFFYDYKDPKVFKNGDGPLKAKQRVRLLRSELETQLAFLKSTLEAISANDQKFILAVHEPSALLSPKLRAALDPYRDRLLVTLTGHVHARWLMNSINLVRPKLNLVFAKYKIQMIPSVWGIDLPVPGLSWGPGAGWARLTFEGGGRKTLYLYHTNRQRFYGIRLS